MIAHGHCFCDICGEHMGQLWNLPVIAPGLLPAPDFRVCDDCCLSSSPWSLDPQPFSEKREGGRG